MLEGLLYLVFLLLLSGRPRWTRKRQRPRRGRSVLTGRGKALHQGRFRETVLFCWSTIDSVFNRRYGALVDAALLDEWGEARDFFKGLDFKLRNKMSAGMHLVANRSLFREPGDFWQRLSASYSKRNATIHRGENASEDEATQAVAVARQIVRIMREV